jgi:hypothetical protein
MSSIDDDPRRSSGETPDQTEPPDPDRPVQGDTTEYIEKGLKEGDIEKLEEQFEERDE